MSDEAPTVTNSARGSDDEYCSATPEGHQYGSISVSAGPVKWVEQCISCNHISSKALREQLTVPRLLGELIRVAEMDIPGVPRIVQGKQRR